MKKTILISLLIMFVTIGCDNDKKKIDKTFIETNKTNLKYIQDTNSLLVFVVSRTTHRYHVFVPVPTDQIDAVKSQIKDYVEPPFLTEYKNKK